MHRRPDALIAHHQIQTVDAQGRPRWSPWPRMVWDGDIRARMERSAGWFPHATCSGLSFRRDYLEALFPLPAARRLGGGPAGPATVELEPDTYLAGPAALLAPVAGIRRVLTCCRLHGANKVAHAGDDRGASVNEAVARASIEFDRLTTVLSERFGLHPALMLDDHLEYQLGRRAFGEISLTSAVLRSVRSPALPMSMRVREAARVLLGRGMSRQVPSAGHGEAGQGGARRYCR
jgi:hypothetical protein